MTSNAKTVDEFLKTLPEDRRAAMVALREVFRKNLDKDYVETMSYGGPCYCVPHSVYPPGYHCNPKQPLPFAGFMSQKNHLAVYLMCTYMDGKEADWLKKAWAKTGKKLDMGKSCIRFKKLEDAALDVIGEAIRRVPVKKYIEQYEAVKPQSKKKSASAKPASKKKRA
jgi:hypothetical protein